MELVLYQVLAQIKLGKIPFHPTVLVEANFSLLFLQLIPCFHGQKSFLMYAGKKEQTSQVVTMPPEEYDGDIFSRHGLFTVYDKEILR